MMRIGVAGRGPCEGFISPSGANCDAPKRLHSSIRVNAALALHSTADVHRSRKVAKSYKDQSRGRDGRPARMGVSGELE